jgi:Flp pilus assembly protein TadG
MRFLKQESGSMTILSTLALGVLMGGMALAVDIGSIHYRQRQLQTAADSAAIAAGLQIGNCGNTVCTNMKTAAAQALIETGAASAAVTPTSSCTVSNSAGLAMIINVGPCVMGTSDPNNGNNNVAEVVLTQPVSTLFAGMLGLFYGDSAGMSKMNLVARAEAGEAYIASGASNGDCIYTKSLEFNSSDGNFNLTNCGIYDLGNLQTDDHDSVTASFFLYQGSWSPNNCNGSCSWTLGDSETQPAHTTVVAADPLASLTAPTKPANSTTASNTTPNNGATLQPGYYPNGVNLNSGVSVNLAPGVYYMNGSINVNSGATLTCTGCTGGVNGVTLYFASGTLQMNSNSTVVQLVAPTVSTNGNNANMLIWESASNSTGMPIDTSSSSYLTGTIYLPDARLTLNSGAGVTINASGVAAIDVADLMVNDSEHFNVTATLPGTAVANPPTLGNFGLAE